jgi:hypothetical protein
MSRIRDTDKKNEIFPFQGTGRYLLKNKICEIVLDFGVIKNKKHNF